MTRRGTGLLLAATAAVLLLDVVSKLIVHNSLSLGGEPIPVLGNLLRLVYVHNPSSAFGLFHGSRWFFIGVSAVSILVILSLALSGRYGSRWHQLAFGMILGGALGNLLDRIWLGVVIDFIEMGIGRHRWPVYNVADIGVTAGVVLLTLSLLLRGAQEEPDQAEEAVAEALPGTPEGRREGAPSEPEGLRSRTPAEGP